MKTLTRTINRAVLAAMLACLPVFSGAALQKMDDSELSDISGQALFVSDMIQGDGTQANGSSGINFYRAGLDAELGLNANIKNLELGRTGPGATDVDLWAKNLAFGCTANSNGDCVDSSAATQLKEFMLTRPYFEFAIDNDDTKTLREVVGVRLGAENAEGPLSIGNFKVFSGYLSATADITMQGQTNVALTSTTDYCPSGGSTPCYDANLGLDDWCLVSVLFCVANADQYQVEYPGQGASYPVTASGKRLTQAQVHAEGPNNLYQLVDNLTQDVSCVRTTSLFGCGLSNAVLGVIAGNVRDRIVDQLSQGLNVGRPDCLDLTDCDIPYNVSNLHQVDVDSPSFGLSFQKRNVQYPGYETAISQGWGMYLPEAFTLDVNRPVTEFTQSILGGNAIAGNLVGLDPVYDNCWGSAQFC